MVFSPTRCHRALSSSNHPRHSLQTLVGYVSLHPVLAGAKNWPAESCSSELLQVTAAIQIEGMKLTPCCLQVPEPQLPKKSQRAKPLTSCHRPEFCCWWNLCFLLCTGGLHTSHGFRFSAEGLGFWDLGLRLELFVQIGKRPGGIRNYKSQSSTTHDAAHNSE